MGFVVRASDVLEITATGRRALEEGVPSRLERWSLTAFTVCASFLALAWLGERVF